MENLFIMEGTRRRKAKRLICKQCKKEFLIRKDRSPECCSSACSGFRRRTQIIIECHTCHAKFKRRPSAIQNSKSGLQFCSRQCKEMAQSLKGGCSAIQPTHYGTGNGYQHLTKEMIKHGCKVCLEKQRFKLTTHHIDGDRTNNVEENLEIVCWNCHAHRHAKPTDNGLVWSGAYLTPRDIVEKFDEEVKQRLKNSGLWDC